MKGLNKAAMIISFIFAVVLPILGIIFTCLGVGGAVAKSAGETDKEVIQMAELLPLGITCIICGIVAIFGAVVCTIANKKLRNNTMPSTGIKVCVLLSGILVNLFGIPAGIMMLVKK